MEWNILILKSKYFRQRKILEFHHEHLNQKLHLYSLTEKNPGNIVAVVAMPWLILSCLHEPQRCHHIFYSTTFTMSVTEQTRNIDYYNNHFHSFHFIVSQNVDWFEKVRKHPVFNLLHDKFTKKKGFKSAESSEL